MRFKERFKKGSERQRKAERDVLPFSERVVTVFKEMRLREFLFFYYSLRKRGLNAEQCCAKILAIRNTLSLRWFFFYKYKCRREPMLNTTAKIPEHIIKRIQHIRKREKRNTTKPPSQDAIQTITVLLNNTIYITTAVLSRAKNSMNKHAHTSCSKSFWNPWINKLKPCKCSVI